MHGETLWFFFSFGFVCQDLANLLNVDLYRIISNMNMFLFQKGKKLKPASELKMMTMVCNFFIVYNRTKKGGVSILSTVPFISLSTRHIVCCEQFAFWQIKTFQLNHFIGWHDWYVIFFFFSLFYVKTTRSALVCVCVCFSFVFRICSHYTLSIDIVERCVRFGQKLCASNSGLWRLLHLE